MNEGLQSYLIGPIGGQTPLDPDEAQQLLPSWVTTRGDLDAAEQENVARAIAWARTASLTADGILREPFLHELHRRMFGDVWRWAGSYRTTARNIGVDVWLIAESVMLLLGDVRYWTEHETFDNDEIAVRFHHRLVAIHPFTNGNGRHARLAADLLSRALGGDTFSWGIAYAADRALARNTYIASLRSADQGDIGPLLAFARA